LILSFTSVPVLEAVEAGTLVGNGGVVGDTGFVLVGADVAAVVG